MHVVKGRYARDALLRTFNIGVLKSGKDNASKLKHTHIESATLIDSSNAAFYTSECWNSP